MMLMTITWNGDGVWLGTEGTTLECTVQNESSSSALVAANTVYNTKHIIICVEEVR